MTEFGAAATLEITEVNGAQAAIEQDVTVPVQMQGGGRPSQRQRTASMGGRSLPTLAEDRNEILNEILDVLEGGGGPANGGGGGGGVGLLGLSARGLATNGAGALLGLGAVNVAGREAANRGGDAVRDLTGTDIGPAANALRTAPGVGYAGQGIVSGGAAFAGGAAKAVQELQEFQWPEPPDPLSDAMWPEYEPLGQSVDWPALPDLSREVDWPDLPNVGRDFWPDIPNPFDGNQTATPTQTQAMMLDGSQPTTSSGSNVVDRLDVNVDGRISVEDARAAVENVVTDVLEDELLDSFRGR